MLNTFPNLLVLGFFAPTLLRIAAGCVFGYLAWSHYRNRSGCSSEIATIIPRNLSHLMCVLYVAIEAAVALGLVLGFLTQVAAILGAIIALKVLLLKRSFHNVAPLSHTAYFLLAVICLSLLVSGAGAYALDLPL